MLVKCTIVSLGKAMVYDCIHLYLFVMHANSYAQNYKDLYKIYKSFVFLPFKICLAITGDAFRYLGHAYALIAKAIYWNYEKQQELFNS